MTFSIANQAQEFQRFRWKSNSGKWKNETSSFLRALKNNLYKFRVFLFCLNQQYLFWEWLNSRCSISECFLVFIGGYKEQNHLRSSSTVVYGAKLFKRSKLDNHFVLLPFWKNPIRMLKRFFKHWFPMWMRTGLNGTKLPPNSLPLKSGQREPTSSGHPCGILNAVSICSSEWSELSLSVTRRLKVQHSRTQPLARQCEGKWNGKIKSDNHSGLDDHPRLM